MGHSHDHHHHDDASNDRRALWIALGLNFAMFLLEIWQGLTANSTSLLADSMDFLSDSLSYIITLYVLAMPLAIRARASLFKAWMMIMLGAFALFQGVQHVMTGEIPAYATMGWVSVLALIANLSSAAVLYRSRGRNSNMRSVWLCSRNDAFNNIGILAAAGLVFYTNSLWPDLAVALFIAFIETRSALQIIRQAKGEIRKDV